MSNFTPKYVSVDIETTGLDPEHHQILEFAAVAWANEGEITALPHVEVLVKPDDNIVGDPYALCMNARLLSRLANGEGYHISDVLVEFEGWLRDMGVSEKSPVHIVGNNFASFDLQFLKLWKAWPDELISHRFFDISTIAATSEGIVSAYKVLGKPVVPGEAHEALYDARVAMIHCQDFFTQKSVFCLTRSGERGILGVYKTREDAEAAANECYDPNEMEIERHVVDSFRPGD
jgi:DNA polymerase III alpha subunit (gram-positive type)